MRLAATLLSVTLSLGSAVAGAQEAHSPRDAAPQAISARSPVSAGSFGGDVQIRAIPVTEFVPVRSGYDYVTSGSNHLRPDAPGTQSWFAPLDLPSGASIEEIRVLVRDNDPAQEIRARLSFVARAADGSNTCDGAFWHTGWDETSAGISGHGEVVLQDEEPWLVRAQHPSFNQVCLSEVYFWHSIWIDFLSTDHSISGVIVRWRRTVSPVPNSATFADVPTDHPFFQFVEALAASGITAGCGSGNYCPDNPLTRGQMAVFLSIALGLHWPM